MTNGFRVLISDSLSQAAAEVLTSAGIEVDDRAGISAEELTETIGSYDALIVRSRTKVTSDILSSASNLKLIGRAGIGVDNIDLETAGKSGIIVQNAPTGNSVTTAEHAICLMLSLTRNIPQGTMSMKSGKWEKKKLGGREIFGKTLGIVGLGNIGKIVADRARGLRMKVIASDPLCTADAAAEVGAKLCSFDELLESADYISIHTPANKHTIGLFGAEAFAKAKHGVFLVNAARGGIVDEDALYQALQEGIVAGAALDVFSQEPPDKSNPLVGHERVICTPHLGASTKEAQEKVAIEIAEQIRDFALRGEKRNVVNSQWIS